MNYATIALKKFGVKVPVFLLIPFIAKVSYYISKGHNVKTAVKKAIKDTLGIKV